MIRTIISTSCRRANPGFRKMSTELGEKPVSKSEYYKVLGIAPDATLTEIREAYFRKVKIYHPDINPSPEAKEKFEEVHEAYKILGNIDRRVGYDRKYKESSRTRSVKDVVEPETVEERLNIVKKMAEDNEIYLKKRKELAPDRVWTQFDENPRMHKIKLDPIKNRKKPPVKLSEEEWEAKALAESEGYRKIVKLENWIIKYGKKYIYYGESPKASYDATKSSSLKYLGLFMIMTFSGLYWETHIDFRPFAK